MPVPNAKLKDISFYSGFSYFRPVARGSVTSADIGGGVQNINNAVVSIPSEVVQRPPYIQYYLEGPSGIFSPVGQMGNLEIGHDSTNIYINGYPSHLPDTTVYKIWYIIFDRAIL